MTDIETKTREGFRLLRKASFILFITFLLLELYMLSPMIYSVFECLFTGKPMVL